MNLPFLVDLSTIYFLQRSLKNNLQADYHDPKGKKLPMGFLKKARYSSRLGPRPSASVLGSNAAFARSGYQNDVLLSNGEFL
jgi:hypothetical protein